MIEAIRAHVAQYPKPTITFDDAYASRLASLKKMVERPELTDKQIDEMNEAHKKRAYIKDGEFDLDDITADENLLKKWYEFGSETQDSYPEYHFATMLVIVGHLFPAEMRPQYAPRGVNNNMWTIILGNSGCGKTMACGAANSILYDERIVTFVSRISNKFTPESMTLSFHENHRRFHYSNEAVSFLKFMKRDYANELSDEITNVYDGEPISKQTIKMGTIFCNNPLYSAVWNTTLDAWGKYATPDQFASGALLRPFYIISTRTKEVKRDEEMRQEMKDLREEVIVEISELLKLVNERKIVFPESEYINDWKHELRVESQSNKYSEMERSALQRVFDQARKVAMNLTIASKEFRDYLKGEPEYTGNLPTIQVIKYEIPEFYAVMACNIAEHIFWKNGLKALKITYGSTGNYGKVMKALEGDRKSVV